MFKYVLAFLVALFLIQGVLKARGENFEKRQDALDRRFERRQERIDWRQEERRERQENRRFFRRKRSR